MDIYVLLQSAAIEPGQSDTLHRNRDFGYIGTFSSFELAEQAIYDHCFVEDSLYWKTHNDNSLWIAEGVTKALATETVCAFKIVRTQVDLWVTAPELK